MIAWDGRGAPVAESRSLLTLRVSRDGGRTWSPEKVIRGRENLSPLVSVVWPPCACPRCSKRA
ncbi:hypothetical protein FNJ62_03180 [Streptomyces benahoarensis]|uniref:Sialidase domain-containing protein n=1 Tax=Streptomyces benahoarensis TaxID=2595054 RepID=A0A553YQU4_9ACTN|nr:hypothetical protein FNZ23_25700 [Streptomyces benahoarensis]TSB32111.1 hypothetical protein FNJ62_03180 [Streptomyces benahoarensis]